MHPKPNAAIAFRYPTENMRVTRRYALTATAVWLALALLSLLTRTPAPALLNYSERNDYGCCEPTVAGDTWFRICGNSSTDGYTFPLIYSSEASGLLISLTITALDYRKDSINYTHLDIESVVVTVAGNSNDLAIPHDRERTAFQTHYSGAIANCTLRLPERMQPGHDDEIAVTATVAVSVGERSDRYTISGVLARSEWTGYWLIFEALAPHA